MRNPYGQACQEDEAWVLIFARQAFTPFELSCDDGCYEAELANERAIESPDPGYYADELAAGR